MHPSFLTQLWVCFCLVLFTASYSNAEPTDPALIGTWETTGVLDNRQWKFTYEITDSKKYQLTMVTTDGYAWAKDGQWTVSSRRGFDDGGTYEFANKDSVTMTGNHGPIVWTRKSTGSYSTGSKIDKPLLGIWTTQLPMKGKQWTFTWLLKVTGRYRLTAVTTDGSFTAHDGQWKSVSASGQTEEGTYAFPQPNAIALTSSEGTGMWTRSGPTAFQQMVEKTRPQPTKKKKKRVAKQRPPQCDASREEKKGDGYPAPLVAKAIEAVRFDNNDLPNGLKVSTDRAVIQTWRGARKDGHCGRGVFNMRGEIARVKVYYLISNTLTGAKGRVKNVLIRGEDDWVYKTVFDLVHPKHFPTDNSDNPKGMCWYQHSETLDHVPIRMACMDLHPVSGIFTVVQGNFELGATLSEARIMLSKLLALSRNLVAHTASDVLAN